MSKYKKPHSLHSVPDADMNRNKSFEQNKHDDQEKSELEKLEMQYQSINFGLYGINPEWTSGNKEIDICIKKFQLKTITGNYERMIEWFPFVNFHNVEKIGEGGFGSIYKAYMLTRYLSEEKKMVDHVHNDYETRGEFVYYLGTNRIADVVKYLSKVALKTLSGSKENPLDFLREFNIHMTCKMFGSKLEIYGLTQNPKTNEYLMVFQYADEGSLYKYLRSNFQSLAWETKLKLHENILFDLYEIHTAGYIHADLHSGNILQDKNLYKEAIIRSYISDLGLSKKVDEKNSNGIYGVLPYVAPEVLMGQPFSAAADIYGFGVIMSEMTTGQRPFDGYEFDINLALKICNGLRPEFAPGTPGCYVELAKQCMDSGSKKRPTAKEAYLKFKYWIECVESSDKSNEIKIQFLKANEIIKKLPINSQKHPDQMYTSKLINTQEISEAMSKQCSTNENNYAASMLNDLHISDEFEALTM